MKPSRRKFLKFLGAGMGVFAAGSLLGPGLFVFGRSPGASAGPGPSLRQFDIKEAGGELRFYDRASKEPILIIEKDALG